MTATPLTAGLLDKVRRDLAVTGQGATPVSVAALLRRGAPAAGAGLLEVTDRVLSEVSGAGVLQPLLRLPDISDVLVNGPGPVWIDRCGRLERTAVTISDEAEVRALAQRLVAACGRRLDDAMPYADARLPDGTRVHAVLPPLAPQGTTLSLRLPARRTFTLDDLVARRAMPAGAVPLLLDLVAARLAYLVTGGTGSGKTTVLSSLLSLVPPQERLVLVEDAAELRPVHPHVVRLEARMANAEGAGGVDLAVLVRQALRMRPDRLVVGEVRGAELREMLTALNTGHEGGCGTLHARRATHVPARVEALAAMAGLDRVTAHSQLAAAVDVVIHLVRDADGSRRVEALAVLVAHADGVRALPAYRFAGDDVIAGPGAAELQERLHG